MGLIRFCRRRTKGEHGAPNKLHRCATLQVRSICEAHSPSSSGEAYGRVPSRGRVLGRRPESPTAAASPCKNFDGILP